MDLREAAQQALEALELAGMSHDVMLMSDPPQDAWKARGVNWKLAEAMNALRAALAEEQNYVNKWVSVEEKLPKEDQLVLGLYKSRPHIVYRKERENIDDRWVELSSGHSLIPPTHWMPLPEYEHVHKMESNPTINEMETVEPVAWLIESYDIYAKRTFQRLVFDNPKNMQGVKITAYYTAPPKRKPLTDEAILAALGIDGYDSMAIEKARAIERAHGIGGEE